MACVLSLPFFLGCLLPFVPCLPSPLVAPPIRFAPSHWQRLPLTAPFPTWCASCWLFFPVPRLSVWPHPLALLLARRPFPFRAPAIAAPFSLPCACCCRAHSLSVCRAFARPLPVRWACRCRAPSRSLHSWLARPFPLVARPFWVIPCLFAVAAFFCGGDFPSYSRSIMSSLRASGTPDNHNPDISNDTRCDIVKGLS